MMFIPITIVQILFVLLHNAAGVEYKPVNSSELQSYLDSIKPGDVINLLPKDYHGDFNASVSGTSTEPITIRGVTEKDKHSKIIGKNIGLLVVGNYWIFRDIGFKKGDVGISVVGDFNKLTELSIVANTEGVIIEGEKNNLSDLAVNSEAQGIVVRGGNNNRYHGNSVASKKTALMIPENSCCGKLTSNSFKGRVEIKGNKYAIKDNSIIGGLVVSGCENVLEDNSIMGAKIAPCNTYDDTNAISTKSDTAHKSVKIPTIKVPSVKVPSVRKGKKHAAKSQTKVSAKVHAHEPADISAPEPAPVNPSESAPVNPAESAPVSPAEPATVNPSEPAPVNPSEAAPAVEDKQ